MPDHGFDRLVADPSQPGLGDDLGVRVGLEEFEVGDGQVGEVAAGLAQAQVIQVDPGGGVRRVVGGRSRSAVAEADAVLVEADPELAEPGPGDLHQFHVHDDFRPGPVP